MKKIFISHSSKDVQFINSLIELIESIGANEKDIFCSSIPGYGIPINNNIYDYLANEFIANDLLIIYALSDNYYKSVACLNEMGAAWVLKNDYMSVLLPGFKYKSIKGAIDPNRIGIKLDEKEYDLKHHLGELKNTIENFLNITSISYHKWERYRDKFISEIKNTP